MKDYLLLGLIVCMFKAISIKFVWRKSLWSQLKRKTKYKYDFSVFVLFTLIWCSAILSLYNAIGMKNNGIAFGILIGTYLLIAPPFGEYD